MISFSIGFLFVTILVQIHEDLLRNPITKAALKESAVRVIHNATVSV